MSAVQEIGMKAKQAALELSCLLTQEKNLAAVCDYLVENKGRIWTDTVYRIARYVKEKRGEHG